MAKGKEPSPCTGMVTISTTPAKGSPKGAKGERVALTGFYSAGGLVKITGGFDVPRLIKHARVGPFGEVIEGDSADRLTHTSNHCRQDTQSIARGMDLAVLAF